MTIMLLLLCFVAVYANWRVTRHLPWPIWLRCVFGLVVFLSALKMPLIGLLYGSANAWLPRWVLLVSGYMQNVALLLALVAMARDLVALGLWLAGRGAVARTLVRGSAVILLVLATLGGGASLWLGVRTPPVREVTLEVAGLDQAHEGLRIAHLTDLHVGPLFRGPWLASVVQQVNAEQPDLVFITGDVVDGSVALLASHVRPLADLRAKHGVFLGAGNHEYYSGLAQWVGSGDEPGEFARLGLQVLYNAHARLDIQGAPLLVLGVGDPVESRYGRPLPNVAEVLAASASTVADAPDSTRLVLAHRPEFAKESAAAGADAQFSGHTHGGLTRLAAPFVARANAGFVRGLYTVGSMPLYVSSGTALWGGFPFRLDVPSEITLITLKRKIR